MPRTQIALETKSFAFKVDSIDEAQGIIRGYLATFNNVDSKDDRIRSGAFKKTIGDGLERKNNKGRKFLWPMLWMHDPEKPIGGFTDAKETKDGLYVTAQLDIRTNEHGVPLNPQAYAVFSGFQMGYIDELSVGYKAIQKTYGSDGVRDLLEMQVFEGSAVTMLFAASDKALVGEVKSGGGSFPLAPKGTAWSKSKAIKDIEAATGGDWSKASKYFFYSAANPTTEADHKLPFVAKVGGSMKAVPQAIISAAAAIQGARGGVKGIGDLDAVKSKIAGYYHKMGMTPPWDNSKQGKAMEDELETKDFNDRYREECIKDWLYTDFNNLVVALQAAVMDIFAIGDEPQADVLSTILNGSGESMGFIQALEDYVQKGIDLDVSNYLDDNPRSASYYGYMSADHSLETKAGRSVSKANSDRLNGHVGVLMQVKDMIHNVAQDLSAVIGRQAYGASGSGDGEQADAGTQSKSKYDRPFRTPANDEEPPVSTLDGELDLDALAVYVASELGL